MEAKDKKWNILLLKRYFIIVWSISI